jgi:hypothetical protein
VYKELQDLLALRACKVFKERLGLKEFRGQLVLPALRVFKVVKELRGLRELKVLPVRL